MQRSFKFILNISSNFFTQIVVFFIAFIITPQIYNKLGGTLYGLLVLLNTIIIYFSLFDFGLISALIKFIAEYKAFRGNLNLLVNTIFSVFTFIIILLVILLNLIAPFIIKQLNIPEILLNNTILSLRILSISFLIAAFTTFFSAITQALHRFELFNLKNIIIGIFIPITTLILLLLNKGIREIIYSYILINTFTFCLFYFIFKKLLPNIKINFTFSFLLFKKIISFGIFKFLSSLGSRIVAQLNEILIGIYLPIKYVGYYSIPSAIAQKISEIIPNISLPLFPLSSELNSLSLNEKLKELYYRSTKLANIILSPITVFIFIFSYSLLATWINPEFAKNANLVLKVLVLAYFINSFAGISSSIVEGLGKTKITALFSLFSSLFYLILVFILLPKYGLIGAALAIFINSLIQVPFFLWYTSKNIIGFSTLLQFTNIYILPLVIACISIVPIFLLTLINPITSLLDIILIFLLYLIIFFISAWFTGSIDPYDKKILKLFFLSFKK